VANRPRVPARRLPAAEPTKIDQLITRGRDRAAGKRPRTTAGLTRAGRTAFERHVAALQQIVSRAGACIL
jgi:hypothetical protein